MGHTEAPPRVRPSTLYPGCLYCENCNATYTPHLEWGYRWPMERNDTYWPHKPLRHPSQG